MIRSNANDTTNLECSRPSLGSGGRNSILSASAMPSSERASTRFLCRSPSQSLRNPRSRARNVVSSRRTGCTAWHAAISFLSLRRSSSRSARALSTAGTAPPRAAVSARFASSMSMASRRRSTAVRRDPSLDCARKQFDGAVERSVAPLLAATLLLPATPRPRHQQPRSSPSARSHKSSSRGSSTTRTRSGRSARS